LIRINSTIFIDFSTYWDGTFGGTIDNMYDVFIVWEMTGAGAISPVEGK